MQKVPTSGRDVFIRSKTGAGVLWQQSALHRTAESFLVSCETQYLNRYIIFIYIYMYTAQLLLLLPTTPRILDIPLCWQRLSLYCFEVLGILLSFLVSQRHLARAALFWLMLTYSCLCFTASIGPSAPFVIMALAWHLFVCLFFF